MKAPWKEFPMGTQNSRTDPFDVSVLLALLDDISQSNGIKCTDLDKRTALDRYRNEGFGFLSKTLPKLGAALDTALRTGKFVCPENFKTYKQTALPVFSRGLLRRIFDNDGYILQQCDHAAITEARQVYYLFYKAVVDFTDKDIALAEEKYCTIDSGLPESYDNISTLCQWTLLYAADFVEKLFDGFDYRDIVPGHGPGAVAGGEKPHEKRHFRTHYKEIHNVYPYYRYFVVNTEHLRACTSDYFARTRLDFGINRVMFVPKDSRGPRTIACEPLEYQFIQQGLRQKIYSWIENHPATKGRINFTDQSVNQRLAYEASLPGSDLITIDMSEASDRVSLLLVRHVFKKTELLTALEALRTPVSRLPSNKLVHLRKYASMGSALCFPVEAIVFYALIYGLACVFGDHKPIIYVYGDDIVLRNDYFDVVCNVFSHLGLKINEKKSCTTGLFRESCGKDYYSGTEINYVKMRRRKIVNLDDLVSLNETSNLLWERCYYNASRKIDTYVNKYLRVPYGAKDSPYLCRYNERFPFLPEGKRRWNKELHRYEIIRPVVTGDKYRVQTNTVSEKHAEYFRKVTQGWSPEFRSSCYARRHSIKLKWRRIDASI